MGNASELSINVVNFRMPKLLTGIDQTVCGRMPLFIVGARRRKGSPANRQVLTQSCDGQGTW
ncbi:hypothetical protein C1H69_00155 [Billgrantia endophytica]|uniref:Uncharacterized protein n=1 Tax=Billgrantia endophytica TaxID=2033802 RepID=A0A2N7UEC1_9GAMM|nr:hypothetical protein C1H69_00155 [Halomonas endophytica]